MARYDLYRIFLLPAILLWVTGCTKDQIEEPGEPSRGGFTLTAVAESMAPEQVVTRATDPKTEAECEIRTLHVFLFGEDGNYLATRDGYPLTQGYQNSITSVLHIDGSAFADPDAASRATVYVVANVEPGTFGMLTEEGYPSKIRTRDDFENFYYQPTRRDNLTSLPESGMPMSGVETGVNLTQTNGSVVVELKALMARIDFSFEINATGSTIGGLPSLVLTECEVRNMATAVAFVAPAEGEESNLDLDNDGQTDATTSLIHYLDPVSNTLYNQQGRSNFSFYVYENLRHPGYAGYPDDYSYPAGVVPEHYQRYKPLLALTPENDTIPATYVVLRGVFTDVDDIDYSATCTIFLGGDPESDFNVRRNHQYRNTVSISGITATGNKPEETVSFDARINVEHTSPYYVSILRHKDLDAHFNVVPMDVYLFDEGMNDEISVSIADPEQNNWVRIERVSADVMRSGQASSDQISHPGVAFAPGTGKRKFFTQNLVTDPSQLGNSIDATMNNRDRLYIYVDENISLYNRQADLILEYKRNGQVKDTRTITLIQHGLLPVRVEDGGVYQYTIYVEMYEEYQNYYDPLSQWDSEQVYDGLQWGPANMGNVSTGLIGYLTTSSAIENYFEGKKGTICVLMATGVFDYSYHWSGYQPDGPAKAMVLDELPLTAAEYCYRKNKTEANGMISEVNTCWYLPAIRELENTLTTYYPIYKDFQDNFYWSSAVAAKDTWYTAEASEYARATMAYVDETGKITHKPSGWDEYYNPSLGSASSYGKALRTESLRVRAVYRPSDGGLIPGDPYWAGSGQ